MSEDPNRYAEGLDAEALRERLEDQQLALDVLAGKYQRAERARQKTFSRFEEIEKQYTQYKALLRDADAYVSQSKNEHDTQLASLVATRAFFHPIRKTPLDVLGLIFEHCFDDLSIDHHLPDENQSRSSRQSQPFRLAAVCRRWRQASLAHPRAWNQLELSFDNLTGISVYRWMNFADTVLARARSAPLNLCLTRLGDSQPPHSKLARRVVSAMPRCLRLDITVRNISSNDALLPVLTAKTPILVQAFLDLAFAAEAAVMHPLPHAPLLHSLCTDNAFSTVPGSLTVAFPLVNAARFSRLSCTDESDHLGCLLRAMPNVRDLRLDLPTVSYAVASGTPLSMPHITSLTLDASDDPDCPLQQILHRVDFPGLKTLALCGDPPSNDCRLQFLRGLPHKARIETLAFTETGGPSFSLLLDELRALPSLVTLSIESSAITGDNLAALQAFLCPPKPPPTWPCRKLLAIRFVGPCTSFAEDCDAAVFFAIINGRAAADDASDYESPDALRYLPVEAWETASRGPIQDRIDHAIRTAIANLTV